MQGAPFSIVLVEILKHTPPWVWGLLAVLVAAGAYQMRDRVVTRGRVLVLPLALGLYSLTGALTTFGVQLQVVVAWVLGWAVLVSAAPRLNWPAGVQFLPARNAFAVPGSGVPLVLMLGVFLVRYVVTVTLILQPPLRGQASVAIAGALAYGLLAGVFAMRARTILAHGAGSARLVSA